jgi:hypothetical protein
MLSMGGEAAFFADLKGLVSETTRAVIVRRYCKLLYNLVQDRGPVASQLWLSRDQSRFIRESGITDSIPKIPDVSVSAVNEWADKWLHVDAFRLKGDSDASWRAITPEQNALRVTMIHDLKNMQEKDLTAVEKGGSI